MPAGPSLSKDSGKELLFALANFGSFWHLELVESVQSGPTVSGHSFPVLLFALRETLITEFRAYVGLGCPESLN